MKRLVEWIPGYGVIRPARRDRKPCERTYGRVGLLWNWRAAWVGLHHSKADRRTCVNLIPFLTIWYTRPGGMLP